MSKRKWTNEQAAAIYTKKTDDGKNCNILVNAAAGSGKTAVLVERIIQKLIPSNENPYPIDVDRLLVVTFTNAAAAEMKSRIADELTKCIEKAEADGDFVSLQYLRRQTILLYSADITTIDAFCMKRVKENFHLLNTDPNFGIADNAQLALIEEEAMDELFEECYEEGNENFLNLADMYSDGRDDSRLADIIYEIYDFIGAMPNPEKWLHEKTEMYLLENKNDNPWIVALEKKKNISCTAACSELYKALLFMAEYTYGKISDLDRVLEENPPFSENEMQFEWGSCYEIVYNEYCAAKKILKADWDESRKILDALVFERWGKTATVRNKEKEIKDKEVKAVVKSYRDSAKAMLQTADMAISANMEEITVQLKERVYPAAKALSELVIEYGRKFSEKKQKKNVLDFSDIEHLCLKLFEENQEVCERLKEKYEEILMDEYQDTNSLQEEIFKKISRGDNLFMVGDMKQSIYRFRRSDPMIFKEKCDSFENRENALNRKIILSANFRSRAEVLESVNFVFERIMSEAAGDINYDNEQQLNNGNKSYEDKNCSKCGGYISECYVLASPSDDEEDDSESIDKTEIEAQFIAHKISQLKISGFMVRDGDEYRTIKNSDITILMSSYKNVADVYIAALNKEGIDCFAESGGYFDKNEVRMMLSLIKIIQNPYQDIPLLGVLRSPVGGFSDDELAGIRAAGDGYIFDALRVYSQVDDEMGEKCRIFLSKLNNWREYTKYMTCDRLIWTLYEETGIYAFVGALYGGEEAQANLRLLFERAKQYESSGYKGLFNFVRYIEKLQRREEDLSGAKLVSENHDVVRIMTIHKSKGLEFPVVFLAGCGKKFLTRQSKIPMHKELGFGMEEINTDDNYRVSTIAKEAITDLNVRESLSEEERKLYVAMTRAKEKLIVTAVVNSDDSGIYKYEERWDRMLPDESEVMSVADVCSAVGFIDWIAPAARRTQKYWHYETVPYTSYFAEMSEDGEDDTKDIEVEIDEFKYFYESLGRVPTKISVTELKMSEDDISIFQNDIELAQKPEFMMEGNKLTGARRGTVLHYVMQKLIPKTDMNADYITNHINKMVQNKELTFEEAVSVDVQKILAFYQTYLGKRVLDNKKVVREATFETEIPLSTFKSYENSEEKILLQGIIDCSFEEDDGIVLIDYKSDYYKNPEELIDKYKKQLYWYSYAIEKITGKRVKEKYIYMFYRNDIAEIQ